jgi:hypothetical protein
MLMMRDGSRRWVFAIVIAVSIPLSLTAQRVPKRVFVSALNGNGAPVRDLKAEEFRITEDGIRRDITGAWLSDSMRIVLLVDSSTATSAMMNNFRIALNGFVDTLPVEPEIAFISSGGQIRVRTTPSTDRGKLKAEIGRFASEGGANAFLETLIEADERFLRKAPRQWPIFVIATVDNGETRREPNLDRYNRFMNDFLGRGGSAHAVVIGGRYTGPVSDMAENLVKNVGGLYATIVVDSNLPQRLKDIANRVNEDAEMMRDKYEVEFSGDARLVQPHVNVEVTRQDVNVLMSTRRPF